MNELRELYQEIILDHNKKPRNCRALIHPTHQADGNNPLCGDKVHVYLKLNGNQLEEVTFEGSGCAISTASASLMTDVVRGKSVVEVEALFQIFHQLITGVELSQSAADQLGKLAVFGGVSEFPVRVKCAALPWHTLKAALSESGKQPPVISTE